MEINLSKIKNVHFIGIGGIGISAIARMMMLAGKKVTGQDVQDSDIVNELRKMGAEVNIGQSYDAIPQDSDLIVYTIAIENYAPELFESLQEQHIPIRSYPQMLNIVSEGKYTIAVSGTHGKTTTTAMIAEILCDAKLEPTVVVGSLLINPNSTDTSTGSNFIAGKSKYFVVEACEYRRSFLNINPNILVITNIEEDHLDYYKDIEDIKSAFRELAMKVSSDGFIICNPNDSNIQDVIDGVSAQIIDYSLAINLNMKLKVPGVYNKKNAGCAQSVARVLSVSDIQIESSLGEFVGTWRRFQFKGKLTSGALIYDDYAHHPTEVIATLEGFRELYPVSEGWKITVLFQPHLYSRTKALLPEFIKSFSDADMVIVLPIYAAREEDDGSVSSSIFANSIVGPNAVAPASFEEAESYIKNNIFTDKDIIVTMGAGVAFQIGDNLLRDL
ncbi:UDP-N-acetylmuramate--L-alanine ligase [Candidatus Nomurabacteria bacterium]|nr:UDP-N-acetylmuramate--L-alanine ligase [Candidatus Nomurabacteria bacterium]